MSRPAGKVNHPSGLEDCGEGRVDTTLPQGRALSGALWLSMTVEPEILSPLTSWEMLPWRLRTKASIRISQGQRRGGRGELWGGRRESESGSRARIIDSGANEGSLIGEIWLQQPSRAPGTN